MSEWARTVKLGKRDASEPGVVKAFTEGGAAVVKHSGKDEPDLFVLFLGVWRPVETKTGPEKLSEGQVRWWREVAKQRPCVVRTPPQARARLKVWAERATSLSSLLRAQRDEAERTPVAAPRTIRVPRRFGMSLPPTAGGGTWAAAEDHEDVSAEKARTA